MSDLKESIASKNPKKDVDQLSEVQKENVTLRLQMEEMQRRMVQMEEQVRVMQLQQYPQPLITPAAKVALQSAIAEPIAQLASIAQATPQSQAIAVTSEQQTSAKQLLTLVISGDQPAAEALLSQNPNQNLASIPGTVTDHAGRTFQGTALQLAVASLDWFMWKMLLEKDNISPQSALSQLKEIESNPYSQAILKNWNQMLEDYDTYIKNYDPWSVDQCKDWWLHHIGKCQHDSPMHVLQEFCNPDRPFHPIPDFQASYQLARKLPDWAKISEVGDSWSFWCGAPAGWSAAEWRGPGGAQPTVNLFHLY